MGSPAVVSIFSIQELIELCNRVLYFLSTCTLQLSFFAKFKSSPCRSLGLRPRSFCMCINCLTVNLPRRNRARGARRSPTPSGTQSRNHSQGPTSEPQSPSLPLGQKPLYLCSPFADAALVKGNFKTIVMLPKYVDIMEWVALNSKWLFAFSNSCLMNLRSIVQCMTFTLT